MTVPTYPLAEIQEKVRAQGVAAFTSTSIATAQDELDLTVDELIEFICSRTDTTCFKTMPSEKISGAMMDVYHWLCPNGVQMAYVKVSLHPLSKIVISFKEL